MKKAPFIFILFSSPIIACNVENLKTLEDVENAQRCMIELLDATDLIIKNYEDYGVKVRDTFEKLIAQEVNCQSWEILLNENPDQELAKKGMDQCYEYYTARQEKYSEVLDEYNKAKENFKGLEVDKEMLSLKIETLKATYDLFVKKF